MTSTISSRLPAADTRQHTFREIAPGASSAGYKSEDRSHGDRRRPAEPILIRWGFRYHYHTKTPASMPLVDSSIECTMARQWRAIFM